MASRKHVGQGSVFGALLAFALAQPAPAWAHRDDYINETFVYETLRGGEFELEGWAEVRSPRGSGQPDQGWYTLAFESGITNRWTLDAAAQSLSGASGSGLRFGRFRAETRYRFREEGAGVVDLAASAEYELETNAATGAGETEQSLTPRLVVSKDIVRDVNTTANLAFPIALSGGGLSFAYALAGRYPAETPIRVGAELQGEPSLDLASVFPQVWFAFPHELTLKLGVGIGLTSDTDPLIGRVVFEAEL